MRKKLNERLNDGDVLNDYEAFDALRQTESLPAHFVTVSIATGHCCGLKSRQEDDINYVYPCFESVRPEFGCCFCSADHQKAFESNLPPAKLKGFYQTVATINTIRSDVGERFYYEFLPSFHAVIASRLGKFFVCIADTEKHGEAYRRTLNEPFAVSSRFAEELHADFKKYLANCVIYGHCETALDNASPCEDFDSSELKPVRTGLISPANSPRSNKQSPRSNKQSPRSNKQSPRNSPRPATSPLVASASASAQPSASSSTATASVETVSAFEACLKIIEDKKEFLKALGQS